MKNFFVAIFIFFLGCDNGDQGRKLNVSDKLMWRRLKIFIWDILNYDFLNDFIVKKNLKFFEICPKNSKNSSKMSKNPFF